MDLNNNLLVIIYHSNIKKLYADKWIKDCCDSLMNQTYQKFDICELNYKKDENYSLKNEYFTKEFLDNRFYYYYNIECKDHTYATNKVIEKGLENGNYHYIAIINVDDYFRKDRFELLLKHINKYKYDLVSSNMYYVNTNNDIISNKVRLSYFDNLKQINNKTIKDEQKAIELNFNKKNNIIAHPCTIFTRRFWKIAGPYPVTETNNGISTVGCEDFLLWKKGKKLGLKYGIHPDYILYYRRHKNQTCK